MTVMSRLSIPSLEQPRIQKIQLSLPYLFGFASISPNVAARFVWIDALGISDRGAGGFTISSQ